MSHSEAEVKTPRGRPRKQAGDLFYDQFAAFPVHEQEIALRILTEMHRMNKRLINGTREANQRVNSKD